MIGYARLLRRTCRRAKDGDDYMARLIEFCKNALCELVPKTDSLSF